MKKLNKLLKELGNKYQIKSTDVKFDMGFVEDMYWNLNSACGNNVGPDIVSLAIEARFGNGAVPCNLKRNPLEAGRWIAEVAKKISTILYRSFDEEMFENGELDCLYEEFAVAVFEKTVGSLTDIFDK